MQEGSKLEVINISDILPNRFQPRIKFEDDSLGQLAASISKYGVIEPIIVRPIGNKYEIIAGERRYKASKLVGKSTIPSIIINLSDKDSEEIALLENVQRRSLNPIEEAVSYKKIINSGNISREELSDKIGKSQSEIQGKVRLLNLSDEVQSYLLNNKISERHARSLLSLENTRDQNEMLHRIVNERLTVKATDREIRRMLENKNDSYEEIEDLFEEEKGDSKMDIDRIMKEAKDINVEEETVKEDAPNLMSSGNDVVSDVIKREDPILPNIPEGPSKFFSAAAQNDAMNVANEADKGSPTTNIADSVNNANNTNNTITFDSMFKSSLLDSQNTDNGISGIVADAMKKYSDNSSESKESTEPAPAPAVPTPVQPAVEPASVLEVSAIEPAPTPVQPAIEPAPASVQPAIEPAPASVQPAIEPAPTPVQPVIEQAPTPVQPVIEPAPASVEPAIEPAPTPVEPAIEPAPTPVQPAIEPAPASVEPVIEPAPTPVQPAIEPAPTPVESVIEPAPTPVQPAIEPAPASVVSNTQPAPGSSPSVIQKELSIPDATIIDNEGLAVETNSVTPIAQTENKITESSNIPSFAKIIKMLRDCADEIEQNGYLINVDEMDLDEQYKVIFTIDKE